MTSLFRPSTCKIFPLIAAACLLALPGAGLLAQDDSDSGVTPLPWSDPLEGRPVWRFVMANDLAFNTDNQFTAGGSVQKFSALSTSLDELQGVRTFGRRLANWVLPDREGLYYRNSLSFGLNMGTPDDLLDPDIILDDVPYVGMLFADSGWTAFNDRDFTGFGITLGYIGEYTFAEQIQKAVHSLVDSDDPKGWDNQLDSELVLQLHYMKKRKLWNRPSFDGAVTIDGSLGNMHTGMHLGVEMRLGRKPGGFSYVPDVLGKALTYNATLPREDGRAASYVSLTARVWAWAVFMPLEGNTFVSGNEWTDFNTIDPENVVGQAILGYHYEKPKWGLHLVWHFATDNVKSGSIAESVDNNFGWITFDWRFD